MVKKVFLIVIFSILLFFLSFSLGNAVGIFRSADVHLLNKTSLIVITKSSNIGKGNPSAFNYLLKIGGYQKLKNRPWIVIHVNDNMPEVSQLKIWQHKDEKDSTSEVIFGCRWNKGKLVGRLWTLEIFANGKKYEGSVEGRNVATRLNNGAALCLLTLIDERDMKEKFTKFENEASSFDKILLLIKRK